MTRSGAALVALCLAQLLIALDYNAAFVALPSIAAALELTPTTEQWIVSAHALTFAGVLLPAGRLVDVLGSRRMFALGAGGYSAGAALAAVSPAAEWLLAARALQGASAALLFPATLAALGDAFAPGRPRLRALTAWGTTGAAAGAVGVVAAGALLESAGWRALFLATGGIAAIAAAVALVGLPRKSLSPRSLDARGGLLAAGFVALVAASLAGRQAPAAAGAALIFACAFLTAERRTCDPLLPPALLSRAPIQAAAVIAFGFMASFGAQLYLFTLHFQRTDGAGVLGASVALLPLTVAVLLGTRVAGVALARLDAGRVATFALASGSLSLLACAACVRAGSNFGLACAMVADGVAQGLCWTALWSIVADAERTTAGVVAGFVATAQQLGGACGLSMLVAVAAAGVPVGFAALAAVLLASAGVAWRLRAGIVLQP